MSVVLLRFLVSSAWKLCLPDETAPCECSYASRTRYNSHKRRVHAEACNRSTALLLVRLVRSGRPQLLGRQHRRRAVPEVQPREERAIKAEQLQHVPIVVQVVGDCPAAPQAVRAQRSECSKCVVTMKDIVGNQQNREGGRYIDQSLENVKRNLGSLRRLVIVCDDIGLCSTGILHLYASIALDRREGDGLHFESYSASRRSAGACETHIIRLDGVISVLPDDNGLHAMWLGAYNAIAC